MALNLFAIPPHAPFLDALAAGWLDSAGRDPLAIANGLILLPTRRSARALAEAFLRVADGRPLLLPRITALGALDEAPLALDAALALPPAVEPMQRLAALTNLILAMGGEGGAPNSAHRAWRLAVELATLMDEADRAEVDLREKLPDAADPAYAAHWAKTLEFLRIVTEFWPAWLRDNGLLNPAWRQVALLDAQATAWTESPPPHPVWVAGITAGIPAVARLLRVVAGLPHGRVVLPALDLGMDEATWAHMEDTHAQAGLARLLVGLDATRGDVRAWPAAVPTATPRGRFAVLSAALLPAVALGRWQEMGTGLGGEPVGDGKAGGSGDHEGGLAGLSQLAPVDQQEEAESIALVLRETLETPDARAALVTPDRALAARVTAALLRHGVVADDSAGEPLIDTPPAVFLRLLTRAVAEKFTPVPLLALLKHPLAAAGLYPAACRAEARELEIACLRGPRPPRRLAGLRQVVDRTKDTRLRGFLAQVERCLEPVIRIESAVESAPAEAFSAVIEAAERLAATVDAPGASRLWSGEEGEVLAERLASVLAVAGSLPDQRRGVLPGFLDAVLEGEVVRSRRAVRGRDGTEHPRVFIWGLLEARLQSADRIVLGGLVEGVWPPMTEPGPWLSRPMRTRVGLPSPEQIVGQAAHDFLAAACSAPAVVLSRPARRDGAPSVPARWLTRLEAFLGDVRLPSHPAASWAAAMDLPADGPRPVAPPRPSPARHLRPRRLSVTEVETWLRDPYAIYARHILRLRPLQPLDQQTDAADYGSLVHGGLHRFLERFGITWPDDARAHLRAAMERELTRAGLRPALVAWWSPRMLRIADWVAEQEAVRRADQPLVALKSEASGAIDRTRPAGPFRLTGRADRIERAADGSLTILDYKTGSVPNQAAMEMGYAPQLLLEAAMAEAGGFGPDLTGIAARLLYWRLTGGATPGESHPLFKGDAAETKAQVAQALERFDALIDSFDGDRPYLSHPHADQAPRFADYAQLARVAEWSAAGERDG